MALEDAFRSLSHVLVLAVLVGILFYLAVWSGFVRCTLVPGGCALYYEVCSTVQGILGNKPCGLTLVVYGEGGMGDWRQLMKVLEDRGFLNANPRPLALSRVSEELLKEYDLVIVTQARRMDTEKMQAFVKYVAQGGRLIWTGDAGAELDTAKAAGKQADSNDNLLLAGERSGADVDVEDENRFKDPADWEVIGPWARKIKPEHSFEWEEVPLDRFLSAQFLDTYCDAVGCEDKAAGGCREPKKFVGRLEKWAGTTTPFTSGLREDLLLYGDFAIVDRLEGKSRELLTLDYQTQLKSMDGNVLGREFPILIGSGFGERAAYYAVPLECWVSPEREAEHRYFTVVENAYEAMLGFKG